MPKNLIKKREIIMMGIDSKVDQYHFVYKENIVLFWKYKECVKRKSWRNAERPKCCNNGWRESEWYLTSIWVHVHVLSVGVMDWKSVILIMFVLQVTFETGPEGGLDSSTTWQYLPWSFRCEWRCNREWVFDKKT